MGRRAKRKKQYFCLDEEITVLIKDWNGKVVLRLPGSSARDYDAAIHKLKEMNGEAD